MAPSDHRVGRDGIRRSPSSLSSVAILSFALLWALLLFWPSERSHLSLEQLRRRHTRRRVAAVHAPLEHLDNSRVLSRAEVLRRIPPGAYAFVTLANAAYADLAINWALILLPLLAANGTEGHAFITALDDQLAQRLVARRLPTLRAEINDSRTKGMAEHENFRLMFSRFRAYGVQKAEILLWLLSSHRAVIMSDVDCAWLDPRALIDRIVPSLSDADVLAGTDCLDVNEDADRSTRQRVTSRCGHHPGSHWSAWFNTGVLVLQPTDAARGLAREWRERMSSVSGGAGENDCKHGCEGAVDDQLTFNQLVAGLNPSAARKSEPIYPVRAARPDGRVIFDGTATRRIAALPATAICSGHVYHVQQGVAPKECVVLHLTFVEAGVAGKFWRLREAGLFPIQPEMVTAHLELVDRFFVALRNSLAIARSLGRALILPKITCLCERAQAPWGILPNCVKEGATTPVPFTCPLEYLLDIEELEGLWHSRYMQLHPWTLRDPRVHPDAATAINADAATIKWTSAPAGGSPSDEAATAAAAATAKRTVHVQPGLSDIGWRAAIASAGVQSARVLHLESADGAIFGGFEKAAIADEFDERIRSHVIPGARRFSGTWCCTTTHYQAGTILYKRPWHLPRGDAARSPTAAEKAAVAHAGRARPCYWEDCDVPGKVRGPDDV